MMASQRGQPIAIALSLARTRSGIATESTHAKQANHKQGSDQGSDQTEMRLTWVNGEIIFC